MASVPRPRHATRHALSPRGRPRRRVVVRCGSDSCLLAARPISPGRWDHSAFAGPSLGGVAAPPCVRHQRIAKLHLFLPEDAASSQTDGPYFNIVVAQQPSPEPVDSPVLRGLVQGTPRSVGRVDIPPNVRATLSSDHKRWKKGASVGDTGSAKSPAVLNPLTYVPPLQPRMAKPNPPSSTSDLNPHPRGRWMSPVGRANGTLPHRGGAPRMAHSPA